MSLRTLALLVAVAYLAAPATADPLFVVVPGANTSTVGNTTDGPDDGLPPLRLQQIFGSNQFPTGSKLLIDQFAQRASPGDGPVQSSIADVQAYLSTSPYYPDLSGGPSLLLTTDFATNLGPDNTLVFSGPVTGNSPGCALLGSTPCPFDMVFNLTTPFLYDPSKGRLLLDLHLTGLDHELGNIDAVDFSDLPIPFGPVAGMIGFLGEPTALEFSAGGTVIQFRYTLVPDVVPEPASAALLLIGVGAAFAMRRRRARGWRA